MCLATAKSGLAHAEEASLDHLKGVRLHISENKQQPILWGREGTGLVHAETAGGPGLPIEAPRRHMGVKRDLEGRHQLLEFVEGHTGEIQKLRRAGLQIGELYMGHRWCLLS